MFRLCRQSSAIVFSDRYCHEIAIAKIPQILATWSKLHITTMSALSGARKTQAMCWKRLTPSLNAIRDIHHCGLSPINKCYVPLWMVSAMSPYGWYVPLWMALCPLWMALISVRHPSISPISPYGPSSRGARPRCIRSWSTSSVRPGLCREAGLPRGANRRWGRDRQQLLDHTLRPCENPHRADASSAFPMRIAS